MAWGSGIYNPGTSGGGGGGSGIVSPATFTWVNNFGISASTIAVSSITFTSGATMNGGTSVPLALNATFMGVGRNRIINGDFLIDQSSGGATHVVTGQTDLYVMDQWKAHTNTIASPAPVINFTQTATSPPATFVDYEHIQISTSQTPASGQVFIVEQFIEGNNVRDFSFGNSNAVNVNLSFWARSNVTGNFAAALQNSDGSNHQSYVVEYNLVSSGTWQYFTFSIPGRTSGTWNGSTNAEIVALFDLGSGSAWETTANAWQVGTFYRVSGDNRLIGSSANYLDITGVQLEIGTGPTAFEVLPFNMELTQCQRYLETSYSIGESIGGTASANFGMDFAKTGTTTVLSGSIIFKVRKRVDPTMTYYSNTGVLGSWLFRSSGGVDTSRAVADNQPNTVQTRLSENSSGADNFAQGHWVADARF